MFNDNGNMAFNEDAKKIIWQQHYIRLLNAEFPRSKTLPHVEPVIGPACLITREMVLKALKKMKVGKAAGPSGIVVERLKASPNLCCKVIAELANAIVRANRMEGKHHT